MTISVINTDTTPAVGVNSFTLGPFTVTAGDALAVVMDVFREDSTGGTVISDNVNGTWGTSPVSVRSEEGGGFSADTLVWALPVSAAGTITITVDPAGSVAYANAGAVQIRATSGVLEQAAGPSGNIGSSPFSAAATLASANYIVVGAATVIASPVSAMAISSPGVEVVNLVEADFAAVHGYRIEAATTNPDLAWTFSASGLSGNSAYAAVILTEVVSAGGGQPPRSMHQFRMKH